MRAARCRTCRLPPVTSTARLLFRLQHDLSFTESPAWIQKMKDRFAALDVDKDKVINKEDLNLLAGKLAEYRGLGSDACKQYFHTLNAVYDLQDGPTTEQEFINMMKIFAGKLDAKERLHGIADMVFEVVDTDNNGELSFDEFYRFHVTSVNMTDEMIKHLFEVTDANGDGAIQRSEYRDTVVRFILTDKYH